MRFEVKIRHSDQRVPVKFGAVNNISDGGYERGREEGEKIGYENGHKDGVTEGYENGYGKGFADGENSVENYLPCATSARFRDLNLFGKADVTINMPLLSAANDMFRFADGVKNSTVEHLTINSGEAQPTNINMMFYNSVYDANSALKHITLNIDTSKATYADNMFYGHTNLVTVDGKPLDFSSVTQATISIGSTPNLADIRFAPGTIKCNLGAHTCRSFATETIQSIVDGYADMTGQTSPTLTVHENVGARMTEEQKATLTAKNVTLVIN